MGLLNLLFGSSEDRKKEMESIEDDLVHIYVYSRKGSPRCLMKKRRISGKRKKSAGGRITSRHGFAEK